MAVVPEPKGARLALCLRGPGLDGGNWFTRRKKRSSRRLMTDDDPVYGPAGRRRQPCAVPRPRTVGRPSRSLDKDALTYRDRVLLPIRRLRARPRPPVAGRALLTLRTAVMQGRVRRSPKVRDRLWHLVERGHDRVRSPGHPKGPARHGG